MLNFFVKLVLAFFVTSYFTYFNCNKSFRKNIFSFVDLSGQSFSNFLQNLISILEQTFERCLFFKNFDLWMHSPCNISCFIDNSTINQLLLYFLFLLLKWNINIRICQFFDNILNIFMLLIYIFHIVPFKFVVVFIVSWKCFESVIHSSFYEVLILLSSFVY